MKLDTWQLLRSLMTYQKLKNLIFVANLKKKKNSHVFSRISRVFVCNFVNFDFHFEQCMSSSFQSSLGVFDSDFLLVFEVVESPSQTDCKNYLHILISETLHVFKASVSSGSREIHGVSKIATWDLRDKRTRTVITVWVEITIINFALNLN